MQLFLHPGSGWILRADKLRIDIFSRVTWFSRSRTKVFAADAEGMQKVSSSYREDQLEDVNALVEDAEPNPAEGDYSNRAEALRDFVDKGLEYDDVVDELETDIQHLEARVDELTNQLQNERDREDDVDDLATFAEAERRARRRRERLEEARRRAGLLEKTKWWLGGEPADLEDRVDDVPQDRAGEG